MRKHLFLSTAILATLGLAGLSEASPLQWEGTVTIVTGSFGTGSVPHGGVATVNKSAGNIPAHLNELRLASSRQGPEGTVINIVTDPDTRLGNGIFAIWYQDIKLGTGTWAPISGGAASGSLTQNVLPVRGVVKLCLLSTACTNFLFLPMTEPTTVNGVPGTGAIGAGIGGLLTIGGGAGTPIRMSLQAAPWTIKTAKVVTQITTPGGNRTFINQTFQGFAHGPASGTTSTAEVSGVVQLVAPTQVSTNLPYGAYEKVASGEIVRIRFIPEPGLLLLLGTGVVGLALFGRRRLRS